MRQQTQFLISPFTPPEAKPSAIYCSFYELPYNAYFSFGTWSGHYSPEVFKKVDPNQAPARAPVRWYDSRFWAKWPKSEAEHFKLCKKLKRKK